MKAKKVNQYECDFCGKKKYAAAAMKKHEKHCTMNPERECRMCARVDHKNDLKKLIAMLPKDEVANDEPIFGFHNEHVSNGAEILEAFEKMKEEANNCPACILAVIRQLRSGVFFDFDYQKSVKEFWAEENSRDEYYFMHGGSIL